MVAHRSFTKLNSTVRDFSTSDCSFSPALTETTRALCKSFFMTLQQRSKDSFKADQISALTTGNRPGLEGSGKTGNEERDPTGVPDFLGSTIRGVATTGVDAFRVLACPRVTACAAIAPTIGV